MPKSNMPGLARLVEHHKEKSHIIKNVIDNSLIDRQAEQNNISNAIGNLGADELGASRIPLAIAELREISMLTEKSAENIMDQAEQLMERSPDQAVAILEACTFQDIVGQRASKVVELLELVEKRLATLVSATGISDNAGTAGDCDSERRRKEQILHGPQLTGEGVSQDEIDALLGA